jgi:hypothetical protein
MILEHRGQHDEAIAALHNAIAIDPKNVAAYNNLGLAGPEKSDPLWRAALDVVARRRRPDRLVPRPI